MIWQDSPDMNAVDLASSAQSDPEPPAGISIGQQALWLVKAGRWDDSHDLCQNVPDPEGAWIHAYLHREEGDLGNASYWYHRAGKEIPLPGVTFDDEWCQIAQVIS
ncbi:hypothetical protein N8688_00120 [bacterium]|nr:hypothetical protein [bacterium]